MMQEFLFQKLENIEKPYLISVGEYLSVLLHYYNWYQQWFGRKKWECDTIHERICAFFFPKTLPLELKKDNFTILLDQKNIIN